MDRRLRGVRQQLGAAVAAAAAPDAGVAWSPPDVAPAVRAAAAGTGPARGLHPSCLGAVALPRSTCHVRLPSIEMPYAIQRILGLAHGISARGVNLGAPSSGCTAAPTVEGRGSIIGSQVRQPPCWPRSWANSSLL
jgi:hypothetical protein